MTEVHWSEWFICDCEYHHKMRIGIVCIEEEK